MSRSALFHQDPPYFVSERPYVGHFSVGTCRGDRYRRFWHDRFRRIFGNGQGKGWPKWRRCVQRAGGRCFQGNGLRRKVHGDCSWSGTALVFVPDILVLAIRLTRIRSPGSSGRAVYSSFSRTDSTARYAHHRDASPSGSYACSWLCPCVHRCSREKTMTRTSPPARSNQLVLSRADLDPHGRPKHVIESVAC